MHQSDIECLIVYSVHTCYYVHTCGIFQKCDISAVGSVARVHPDPMAAIFVLSSLSWLNRVLWDWNLTHCLGVIRQGNYMVAEANNTFRPLSNAVHCCAVLLTLKDFSRPPFGKY